MRQEILDKFGLQALKAPCASIIHVDGFEKEYQDVLKKISPIPNVMVEIGTCSGVSAAYFSRWANHVHTFDIVEVKLKYDIWKHFGMTNITAYHASGSPEIAEIIKGLTFDFAFIDAAHEYKDAIQDIEMVKRCGRILFHDYYYKPVKKAIAELITDQGGKLTVESHNFALWER